MLRRTHNFNLSITGFHHGPVQVALHCLWVFARWVIKLFKRIHQLLLHPQWHQILFLFDVRRKTYVSNVFHKLMFFIFYRLNLLLYLNLSQLHAVVIGHWSCWLYFEVSFYRIYFSYLFDTSLFILLHFSPFVTTQRSPLNMRLQFYYLWFVKLFAF